MTIDGHAPGEIQAALATRPGDRPLCVIARTVKGWGVSSLGGMGHHGRLGPDHPDALAWLWAHWGTTAALRHVTLEPAPALRRPPPVGRATLVFRFWSSDWTPWRALEASAARWPDLRFAARPTYDDP